jgi:hypothetical protein
LWHSGDQGDRSGFFGAGFTMADAWRVAGSVDVAALQGALDDLVERHEILRTVVVRDAHPPHQEVRSARAVPLRVREVPEPPGPGRDTRAEELLAEAEQVPVDPRAVPLLAAGLDRFDGQDAVLTLVTHHTACDEWSVQVMIRDLAALYTARTTGRPAALPPVHQYREFAGWQRDEGERPDAGRVRAYWKERMRGAAIFAAPTDRPVPATRAQACSAHHFTVDAQVMAAAGALAGELGGGPEVVAQAAFNLLVHRVAGTTDQAVDTLTSGRTDPRFDDTVGAVMNFLVFRTDLAASRTFRDVLRATHETCRDSWRPTRSRCGPTASSGCSPRCTTSPNCPWPAACARCGPARCPPRSARGYRTASHGRCTWRRTARSTAACSTTAKSWTTRRWRAGPAPTGTC